MRETSPLLIALLLSAFPCTVIAATWQEVAAGSEGRMLYLDRDSIRLEGHIVTVNVLQNNSTDQPVKDDPTRLYRSEVQPFVIDCNARRLTFGSYVSYAQPMGQGDIVATDSRIEHPTIDVRPGSIADKIAQVACAHVPVQNAAPSGSGSAEPQGSADAAAAGPDYITVLPKGHSHRARIPLAETQVEAHVEQMGQMELERWKQLGWAGQRNLEIMLFRQHCLNQRAGLRLMRTLQAAFLKRHAADTNAARKFDELVAASAAAEPDSRQFSWTLSPEDAEQLQKLRDLRNMNFMLPGGR